MSIAIDINNYELFINRELSWLEFNTRVLDEARDKGNPLLERVKFLAITSSNLDEFFMVRVGSLKEQVRSEINLNKRDFSGLTNRQQLDAISLSAHKLVKAQYHVLNHSLLPLLEKKDIFFLKREELTKEHMEFLTSYFYHTIYPVLTPMAADSSRPLPLIRSRSLNIGVIINKGQEENVFATVQVPSVLPRAIELPNKEGNKGRYFIFLEEVIKMFLDEIFAGQKIVCAHLYRITRNADLEYDEDDAEDLLEEIKKSLKKRQWGIAVRLEVDSLIDERLLKIIKTSLKIEEKDIYYIKGPLDLSFFMKISSIDGFDDLKYLPYNPQIPKDLLGAEDIFESIRKKDILLTHPYESFAPVVHFIDRASKDPDVLAIKQTLYRVSGDSPIVKSLIQAAERGKQVMVLLEVRARFDEENNINWAKKLEKAGCHVIYGLARHKVHCKITLVVRREENKIKKYIHMATGNYNDVTAKLYTDTGLFTCNEHFGADASSLFNMLSGYCNTPEWSKFAVAPVGLKDKFIELIEKEKQHALAGKKALLIAKMNSLVDPEMIVKLYEASLAGVEIKLIVRGICCLRPGVKGLSEKISVISIVGRFLEHDRIYYFHNDGEGDVFLSSADWMPRNLNKRVELLFPVENQEHKDRLFESLKFLLKNTVKGRIQKEDGTYKRIDKRGKPLFDSQLEFCKMAIEAASEYEEQQDRRNY